MGTRCWSKNPNTEASLPFLPVCAKRKAPNSKPKLPPPQPLLGGLTVAVYNLKSLPSHWSGWLPRHDTAIEGTETLDGDLDLEILQR